MNRRRFLLGTGAAMLSMSGCREINVWPERSLFNPCLNEMPPRLVNHPVIRTAWEGVDAAQVWDCHVHLAGLGDGGTGIWVNPDMDSLMHPLQYIQKNFYLNASCTENQDAMGRVDAVYVERLVSLLESMQPANVASVPSNRGRLMIFAFDWHYSEDGTRREDLSTFHVPNHAAKDVALKYPQHFIWVASIHPYRKDALIALEASIQEGAVAVKWLPAAMGIDPDSPRCDAYFEIMARHNLPLIVHAGEEKAVQGEGFQHLGNPLKLRRALAAGVRVVVAHCASHGMDIDTDHPDKPVVESFELFERMMAEPRYQGRLFGEISAVTQMNRMHILPRILKHSDWHTRLLHGSDYPLVGIMPLFSVKKFAAEGLLDPAAVSVIQELRDYNPLLFDFVLKRHLRLQTTEGIKKFPPAIFTTRTFFARPTLSKSL